MKTRRGAKRGGRAPSSVQEPKVRETFPTADRFTRSGKPVGDICFECECRILEIGGPDGMLLAWCECAWPDDHAELEIG
jgi:hypothetical protein